jgi:hypothetical protein
MFSVYTKAKEERTQGCWRERINPSLGSNRWKCKCFPDGEDKGGLMASIYLWKRSSAQRKGYKSGEWSGLEKESTLTIPTTRHMLVYTFKWMNQCLAAGEPYDADKCSIFLSHTTTTRFHECFPPKSHALVKVQRQKVIWGTGLTLSPSFHQRWRESPSHGESPLH